jgi:group I intron endonuclease
VTTNQLAPDGASFIVYRLTCLPTGKIYIGYTSKSIESRFSSHIKFTRRSGISTKSKIRNAILKYGTDCWRKDVLQAFDSEEEARLAEIHFIAEYDSIKNGYNIEPGGKGVPCTPEHRLKISQALKGKPKSDEHKRKLRQPHPSIAGPRNYFYGKHHSEETKVKIANRYYRHGPEHHFYGKIIKTSFKPGDAHPRSQPVIVDGQRYGSLRLAAESVGLCKLTLRRMLDRGDPRIQRTKRISMPKEST